MWGDLVSLSSSLSATMMSRISGTAVGELCLTSISEQFERFNL
jgi:hypothetical protein